MTNLYEMLAQAQQGEDVAEVGRELGLSPQQTQAAVAALLPALSMGLKRSTGHARRPRQSVRLDGSAAGVARDVR
jgi:hypothetical protein